MEGIKTNPGIVDEVPRASETCHRMVPKIFLVNDRSRDINTPALVICLLWTIARDVASSIWEKPQTRQATIVA